MNQSIALLIIGVLGLGVSGVVNRRYTSEDDEFPGIVAALLAIASIIALGASAVIWVGSLPKP